MHFSYYVIHILSTSLTYVASVNPCPVEVIQIYSVIRNTVNPGQPASVALLTSTTDDLKVDNIFRCVFAGA